MFGLFRKKATPEPEGVLLVAHLSARLMPIDRGEIYEDPLDEALGGSGEVTGGGSLMADNGEIAHSDVEIVVPEITENVLDLIVATLEAQGVPRGSYLHDADGNRLRDFGQNAIVALDLDGANLPDEVYKTYDTDDVVSAIHEKMGRSGKYQGLRMLAETAVLYFHGPDATAMEAAIAPVIAEHPLCQNATTRRLT